MRFQVCCLEAPDFELQDGADTPTVGALRRGTRFSFMLQAEQP